MPSPGIPNKDEALPEHLLGWLNQFKGLWYDAATRTPSDANTQNGNGDFPPNVPHVGDAGEIEDLSSILSVRANAAGYDYRQYLTSDRNLAELAVIDTVPKETDVRGESAVLDPEIIMDEQTVLEHLIPADDERSVVEKIRRTMENFRLIQEPGTYNRGDPLGVLNYDPETGSEVLQKQWADIDPAINSVFGSDAASKAFLKRARIRDLVFQNFNSDVSGADRDARSDILPAVSDGIHDHIAALLKEDVTPVRKMEQRLPVEATGDSTRVDNRFKIDDYQVVFTTRTGRQIRFRMLPEDYDEDNYDSKWIRWYRGKPWLQIDRWSDGTSLTDGSLAQGDDQPELFASNATLQNVGDSSYSVQGDDGSFTNYVPGTVQFINRWAEQEATYNDLMDEWYVWRSDEVVGITERKARYQRLGLLHSFGQHPGYDDNPAVLGSLLHHLLRFGLLRARLSGEARSILLNDDERSDLEVAQELNQLLLDLDVGVDDTSSSAVDADPRVAQLRTSLRYLHRLELDELEQLLRETLDLASHRLDAWWSSLATRRLVELRNDQENWYRQSVDYSTWSDADPYVPQGPAPPDGPDGDATEIGTDADDAVVADPATETALLDDLINHLNTVETEYDGEDSLADQSFVDAINDALSAYEDYIERSFPLWRSKELTYLHQPVLDHPTENRSIDFFERADIYLGSLGTDEITVEPVNDYRSDVTIRDEVDYLERIVEESGDWSNLDETPFERLMTPPAAETISDRAKREKWTTALGSSIAPLIKTFEFMREAAKNGAGTPEQRSAGTDDERPFDPPEGSIDPGVGLPEENSSGVQVGAWGYVENLKADSKSRNPNIDQSEYVHAPSMEQATTAAILRGGHEAFTAEGDSELSSIDLSPTRVQTARQLLDGVREGQPLGALLGYRFERALHEADAQTYIHDFREGFPKFTGNLDGPDSASAAAKSDVVNGYALYRAVEEGDLGLQATDEYPDSLPEPAVLEMNATDDQIKITWALEQLFDVVDALSDVLTAESVHQFAQGNYSGAAASLESLAAGDTLPDPEVIETPRTETAITNRLLVTFGDATANTPQAADTSTEWLPEARAVHPELPAVGAGASKRPKVEKPTHQGRADGFPLATRADAEPNLNAWVGDLLPKPESIGCKATYEWAENRSMASGSFGTPAGGGPVSVTDVGFEPDLIVFTASTAVPEIEAPTADSDAANASGGPNADRDVYGWTHGTYQREPGGNPVQHSVSLGSNTASTETTGTADTENALTVVVQPSTSDAPVEHVAVDVTGTTPDGFEMDVTDTTEDGFSVAVEYLAYKVGDDSMVEVGSFTTPDSTGVHPEQLDVDADHIRLTVTDLIAPGSLDSDGRGTQSTTGATGLSHGEAVGDASSDQHAVSLTHDPSGATSPSVTARQGSVVDLPAELVASVEQLGSTLKLDYSTVDSPKLVTYVAVETEPGESPPRIGVVEDGANEVVPADEEFTPACVEFVAIPGPENGFAGGSGVTASQSPAGWSHGVATAPGREQVLHHAVDPGSTVEPVGAKGSVVSVQTGDAHVTATLESFDDRGFTVNFPDGKPDDVLVLYRAWPKTPTERDHVVPASLTLADLDFSPLDALFFPSDEAEGERTQFEDHIAYYLHRNHDAAVEDHAKPRAAIPASATISLSLRESDDTETTVAEIVEVVRALREMVTDGHAADADDFAPPAERTGPGYDRGTYAKLAERAGPLQAALADVKAQLDNRVELLDPTPSSSSGSDSDPPDPPNVAEQVDRIQEALETFRSTVPVSGIDDAIEQMEAATDPQSGTVLESELETLADHLPAGPSDPAAGNEDVTVQRLTGQPIGGIASVNSKTDITVRVLAATVGDAFGSASGTLKFEKRNPTTTDDDGAFEVPFDFHDAPLGAEFDVVALDDEDDTIVYSASGRVVDPQGDVRVNPGQSHNETVTGETDLAKDTPVTVSVTSRVDDAPNRDTIDWSNTTKVDDDGGFSVDVDVSGAVERTALDVTATTTGSNPQTVHRSNGYVRDPDAERSIDELFDGLVVVPRLVWLARYVETIDPTVSESAAASFEAAIDGPEVDWPAILAEKGVIDSWATQGGGTSSGIAPRIGSADQAVLSALPGLKSIELEDLAGSVEAAIEPIEHTIGPAVDVTGGDDRIETASFWLASNDHAGAARMALLNLLRNPAGRTGFDQAELQFAPELSAFALRAPQVPMVPFDTQLVDRIPEYLQRLFEDGSWLIAALQGDLSRPDEFFERFRKLAYRPEQFHADGDRVTFESELQSVVAAYKNATTAVRELSETESTLNALLNNAPQGTQPPRTLREIETILSDMGNHLTRSHLEADLEALEKQVERLVSAGGPSWLSSGDLSDLEDAVARLARRIRSSPEALNPVDRLQRDLFQGIGDGTYYDMNGNASQYATPATEFVYFLTELRLQLDALEMELTADNGVYDASGARSAFGNWWTDVATESGADVSLADAQGPVLDPVTQVDRSTRLNETFRRCLLETVRLPLLRASYFGVHASTPQAHVGGSKADEEALLGQALGAADRIDDRLAAAGEHVTAVTDLVPTASTYADANTRLSNGTNVTDDAITSAAEHELARLEALFDDAFVVLPPLSLPNQPEISDTLRQSHTDELLSSAEPLATETWLQRAARVRDRPALFREALSYAEMVTDRLIRNDLRVGQLPYRDDDDWVGLDGVTPEPGQVSLVTHFASEAANRPIAPNPGTRQGQTGSQVAALRVDEWRTTVPREEETTGVALNYDDPNTEPPQSILLAVLPEDESWSTETLVRTILETTDLAKIRGVDLNQLGKPAQGSDPQRVPGHYLPALTFPLNTDDIPDVPSVDFKLDQDIAESLLYDDDESVDGGDGS